MGAVGDLNAFFLIPDRPEVFNLPPKPVLPSTFQKTAYTSAFIAAMGLGIIAWNVLAAKD